ncbi:MAG TPA: oxygenase MpaB family protein [Solirubrobacteraceae bacterium]|nr:oxygenase MpaB family protein [Solirubrobacteraceae bacterium]
MSPPASSSSRTSPAAAKAGRRARSRPADGYFAAHAAIRQVHRERVLALAGPRALLMQAAHPLAVVGLLSHSGALEEPYERLARTAQAMSAITFGSRAQADRTARRIRAMHRRVRGTLPAAVGRYPAGTPYRADDPRLLLWVLFTLVDSALVVHRAYVGGLPREREAELWQDYRVLGRLFGLADAHMPADLDELHAYRRRMLEGDELHVTEWARRRARQIVLQPPVPALARPALETANFITIALLPPEIRRQYRFSPLPPAVMREQLVGAGASYFRHLVLPLVPARLRYASPRAPAA